VTGTSGSAGKTEFYPPNPDRVGRIVWVTRDLQRHSGAISRTSVSAVRNDVDQNRRGDI
jgi:hypothetical protein